jgi:hypothetical protein
MLGNLPADRVIEEQPSLCTLTRDKPAVGGLSRPSPPIRDGDWLARQGQLEERDAKLAGKASKFGENDPNPLENGMEAGPTPPAALPSPPWPPSEGWPMDWLCGSRMMTVTSPESRSRVASLGQ